MKTHILNSIGAFLLILMISFMIVFLLNAFQILRITDAIINLQERMENNDKKDREEWKSIFKQDAGELLYDINDAGPVEFHLKDSDFDRVVYEALKIKDNSRRSK